MAIQQAALGCPSIFWRRSDCTIIQARAIDRSGWACPRALPQCPASPAPRPCPNHGPNLTLSVQCAWGPTPLSQGPENDCSYGERSRHCSFQAATHKFSGAGHPRAADSTMQPLSRTMLARNVQWYTGTASSSQRTSEYLLQFRFLMYMLIRAHLGVHIRSRQKLCCSMLTLNVYRGSVTSS